MSARSVMAHGLATGLVVNILLPDGASFEQLGWHVDLSQFAGNQLIDAQRPLPAPALHVRVKLDAAEPAASAASAT